MPKLGYVRHKVSVKTILEDKHKPFENEEHLCKITDSWIVSNTTAVFRFRVISGPYTGDTFLAEFMLNSPNEELKMKERQRFTSLCDALGVSAIEYTEETHNIPVLVRIAETFATDGEMLAIKWSCRPKA